MIAQLAVAAAVYAIDKPYSYRVPEGMQVQPGLRVLVPFGRGNRRSEAVVLALQDTAQRDLKVIERALDDAPILSQAQLQLAAFMKERYFCTFYEAVKAILPAGFWFAEKKTRRSRPARRTSCRPAWPIPTLPGSCSCCRNSAAARRSARSASSFRPRRSLTRPCSSCSGGSSCARTLS